MRLLVVKIGRVRKGDNGSDNEMIRNTINSGCNIKAIEAEYIPNSTGKRNRCLAVKKRDNEKI